MFREGKSGLGQEAGTGKTHAVINLQTMPETSPVRPATTSVTRTRSGLKLSRGASVWAVGRGWRAGQESLRRVASRRSSSTWPGDAESNQCRDMIGASAVVWPMTLTAAAATDRNTMRLLANATQNTGREGWEASARTAVASRRDHSTHFLVETVLRSNIATPPEDDPAATRRPHDDAANATAASVGSRGGVNMLTDVRHAPLRRDHMRIQPVVSIETAAASPCSACTQRTGAAWAA